MTKTEKKSQKPYFTDYNSLTSRDLWEAYNQTILKILLNEFIKINGNTYMTTEKCKTCGIKYKDCDCFLEFTNLSDNLKKYKHIYVIRRIVKKKFNENLKKKFLMDRNFTTIISISFILLLQKVVHPYELINQCNFITDNF